ncbi:MAG: hypothetical protein JXR52_01665 [Bacteroidales bacterium]|nr:hypothetical protein [Bacteroidales bacterium]
MGMSYHDELVAALKDFPSGRIGPLSGTVGWTCPSNIAIVKYWGKRPVQIPMNPSLSITLDKAVTETRVDYSIDPGRKETGLSFFFEKKPAPDFEARILKVLTAVTAYLPFLKQAELTVHSRNSFPHSSGIASSASAMGALALCLCEMEEQILKQAPERKTNQETKKILKQVQDGRSSLKDEEWFFRKASFIARLGSGSASRSVYGNMALWGESKEWAGSSNEYAIPVIPVHRNLGAIRDTILIVESGAKKVSSSAGHALMQNNPFAEVRFRQAGTNLSLLKEYIASGDWKGFIEILETEALTLHAMMMTGRPGYLLMQPESLKIISLVREYRNGTGHRVGFTLDAGANVHLIYAEEDAKEIDAFIGSDLRAYCENGYFISDRMGNGPSRTGTDARKI